MTVTEYIVTALILFVAVRVLCIGIKTKAIVNSLRDKNDSR